MKKRFRSLNFALVGFVFLIMITASGLSGIILLFLDSNKIFIEISSTKVLFLIAGLITSTIIGTLLTFPIGKYLLKPLNDLIIGTGEVARGNFNIKIKELKRSHEVGELIKSFNIMTRELRSIEMFQKDFINNFSHEFKTPIVSIRGFARQLKNPELAKGRREEYIDIIVKESERLSNMSSNILLLTKLENQEIVRDKKYFALDEQIRSSILVLQMEWEKKDIEFNIDLEPINYYNNEEMFFHIWLNLISNAIKFSHKGGQIKIKSYQEDKTIIVEISDQGLGMDEKTRLHLFDTFYQGDPAHLADGNGLGMALVKRILTLSGGGIEVNSELGEGSHIKVILNKEE